MSIQDLRWYDDLDQFGSDTADDSESLQQDCYHVIIEDPGTNLQDPNSGLGVENTLSGEIDPAFAALAEAQIATDQRVAGVEAVMTDSGAGTVKIDVAIEPDPDYVDTTDTINFDIPITSGSP